MAPRLILIDAHRIVRLGLRLVFEKAGLNIVAEASTAEESFDLVSNRPCDLVLIDPRVPGTVHGDLLIAELRRRFPNLPILVLTMPASQKVALRALQAGANGYVPKSADSEDVLLAVEAVRRGGIHLHSGVATGFIGTLCRQAPAVDLSEEDKKLLVMVAHGCRNREIATRVNLSVSSVKTRLNTLFARFAVNSRTCLAAEASRLGLLEGVAVTLP